VFSSKNINHKFVGNLPTINEIKHPKRGEKRYKIYGLGTRWMDPCLRKEKKKTTNKGEQQREHQQINYSNPPNCKKHIR
jgi:hypothetical protein